jgi:hypothetical protein
MFRKHGHGPQRGSRELAANGKRAVHDVTRHPAILCPDQGTHGRAVRPQCIDEARLARESETPPAWTTFHRA